MLHFTWKFSKRIYGDDYQPSPQVLKHIDEVLKLLEVLTGDPRWVSVPKDVSEKEDIVVSTVLDYRENKGKAEGRAEGKAESKAEMENKVKEMRSKGFSAEEILKTLLPKAMV